MANLVTNQCKTRLMEKAYDLDTGGDTIKVALLDNNESPNADDTTFSNTNEVSGTGYTAGGQTLANQVVSQDDTDDEGVWDGDNIVWSSSTITARYAVIYNTTVSNEIIGYIDFTENKISAAGTFTITWNAEGILNIN